MKTKSFSILIIHAIFFCSTIQMHAQVYSMPLSLVSNSGGQGQVSLDAVISSVHWTLGETCIGAGQFNNQSIAIGLQQAFIETGVHTEDLDAMNIQVYPNPAHAYIVIDRLPEGKNMLSLVRSDGTRVYHHIEAQTTTEINTSHLSPGLYYLWITMPNHQILSYSISIINN